MDGLLRYDFELEHDILNSLYGVFQVSFKQTTQDHTTVEEGGSRNRSKGFYNRDKIECISAVIGVIPFDDSNRLLYGRLFKPINPPKNPISLKLWVRLRNALFGKNPDWILDRMRVIPGISDEEVKLLVENGVDYPDFFANGEYLYSETFGISKMRFQKLMNEAQRYMEIITTGKLECLQSAESQDLTQFHLNKIYTIQQLKATNKCPDNISQELWNKLLKEASDL